MPLMPVLFQTVSPPSFCNISLNMSNPEFKVVLTADGTPTVKHPVFGALYHSHWGALQESVHIFIRQGLEYYFQHTKEEHSSLKIFEMGFGTGLNAFLSLQWAVRNKLPLSYHTIEKYPIDEDTVEVLNYPLEFEDEDRDFRCFLLEMHRALSRNTPQQLHKYFDFLPIKGDIEEIKLSSSTFDIVFYDAFAPGTQATLWEAPVLMKMYEALVPGGVLLSFCAQGAFKRTLRKLGFEVFSPPGPKGKREMTRAVKL